MKSKFSKVYIVAISVLITAVLCFMTSSAYYNGKLIIKPGSNDKLNTVTGILEDYYFGEYDKDKATDSAVKAYVNSLGDPYTEYMNAEELNEFNSMINSSYCGIGVTVQNNTDDNTILVVSVFKNSPAEAAGIESGDIITKVDGIEYKGEQLQEATENIQGLEGTDVVVSIIKKSTGDEVDLTITRQSIKVESVESQVMDDNIGYISISQFSVDTGKEFSEQLDSLTKQGINGLIIDVRDNGGGVTTAVEAVADCLLSKGDLIYYTSDKKGKKKYVYSKFDGVTDVPLVILANGNSASASEILIGSIKDNKRGKIVGEKSYGKGVVQQLVQMSDGTAVKVTTEKYFTPSGNYIHKKGIEPDYEVKFTEKDTADVQLEKALELLK